MKIVKQGVLPGHRMCRGACTNCGAVVEYRVDEARAVGYPRDGISYIVKCPTEGCDHEIYGGLLSS